MLITTASSAQNEFDRYAARTSKDTEVPAPLRHGAPVPETWPYSTESLEVFAEAGISNIRLPYPVNPANADRVRALLNNGVTLSLIVDDLDVARGWSHAMAGTGRKLDVLV